MCSRKVNVNNKESRRFNKNKLRGGVGLNRRVNSLRAAKANSQKSKTSSMFSRISSIFSGKQNKTNQPTEKASVKVKTN